MLLPFGRPFLPSGAAGQPRAPPRPPAARSPLHGIIGLANALSEQESSLQRALRMISCSARPSRPRPDRWQIFRYLVPAFFTYLLIFYNPFSGLSQERTDGLLNPLDVWNRAKRR